MTASSISSGVAEILKSASSSALLGWNVRLFFLTIEIIPYGKFGSTVRASIPNNAISWVG